MSKLSSVSNRLFAMGLASAFILLSGCGDTGAPAQQVESKRSDPTLNPLLKWKVELGDKARNEIHGNLAAADGVVYTTTEWDVYAFDAVTGKVKWKITVPSHALSSPAVANDMVYFGGISFGATSSHDLDTRIQPVTAYALDTHTGSIKWQHELSNDRSADASNPVVADGLVYFGTGWSDYSCCEHRGNGGHIIALDAKTGQLVWQIDTVGNYGSGGSPTTSFGVANGMLYLGAGYEGPNVADKQLKALDGKTGKDVWKIDSDANFPLVAPDGTLYIVLDRELLSIDGKTGRERWRWQPDPRSSLFARDQTNNALSNPAIAENTVFIVGNEKRDSCFEGPCAPPPKNHSDTLYALDPVTGKERREHEIDAGYSGARDITLFERYLCYDVADFSGDTRLHYLRAVNRDDGKFAWQFEIDGSVFGLPAIANNTMYVGTSNGTIYALQVPSPMP